MAKGWIKAKQFKQKKYRERSRGVMKRFSSGRISGGQAPNQEVMSWYRNAAKGLSKGLLAPATIARANQPRQEALELRDKIKNACPEYRYFRLVDDPWLRARMYFDLNPEVYIIVEYNPKLGCSRRSIPYFNRDIALQRWYENTTDWVDFSSFYHPRIPETFPPT